jgi:hypothetical protein
MRNSRTVAYELSPKALMISQRGVKYQVKALSGASDLYAFSFVTLVRGAAAASASVTEGELPQILLSRLPAGVRPVKAWEFFSGMGAVQGDIVFELKAAKAGIGQAAYSFFYLSSNGWKEAVPAQTGEDIGNIYLSVSAPFSTHYVMAVKTNP